MDTVETLLPRYMASAAPQGALPQLANALTGANSSH